MNRAGQVAGRLPKTLKFGRSVLRIGKGGPFSEFSSPESTKRSLHPANVVSSTRVKLRIAEYRLKSSRSEGIARRCKGHEERLVGPVIGRVKDDQDPADLAAKLAKAFGTGPGS